MGSSKVTPTNTIKKLDSKLIKKFEEGQIYEPFDLSINRLHLDGKGHFQYNLKKKNKIHLTDLYCHPSELSKYLNSTGQILSREVTGLSEKDQRRISKAIRRAQALGLLNVWSKDESRLPIRFNTGI